MYSEIYYRLRIQDHLRGNIAEPVFATKLTGTGTGLGLSLSYDIVTQATVER